MSILTKRIITDIKGANSYLIRWSLWLLFGYSIKLHKIVRPDDDRCSHDHPFWFFRIILWGGYIELQGPENKRVHIKPWRPWAPWRIYFCPVNFRHRIIELPNGPSWTIGLFGPKEKDWGFFTKTGFMQWEEFVKAAETDRVMWCDDGMKLGSESKIKPYGSYPYYFDPPAEDDYK